MERDLTAGSVFKTVIYFSLPYLLSYFLQTLYGMADLFIVGQFGGVSSTTAVSMVSIVICVGVFVWMNKHTEKYMERT
jgi:Na+-driven multidrug efflux pump